MSVAVLVLFSQSGHYTFVTALLQLRGQVCKRLITAQSVEPLASEASVGIDQDLVMCGSVSGKKS